jgi:hypothetical protein
MQLFAYIIQIKYANGKRSVHPDVFASIHLANEAARKLYDENSKQDRALARTDKWGMQTHKVPVSGPIKLPKDCKPCGFRIVKTKVACVMGRTVTVK